MLAFFCVLIRQIFKHDAKKVLQRITQMFFIKWPIRHMQIFPHGRLNHGYTQRD